MCPLSMFLISATGSKAAQMLAGGVAASEKEYHRSNTPKTLHGNCGMDVRKGWSQSDDATQDAGKNYAITHAVDTSSLIVHSACCNSEWSQIGGRSVLVRHLTTKAIFRYSLDVSANLESSVRCC